MNSSNPNKFTIADVLANFGKRQAQVQQEKSLKDQLKQALMQNQAQELGQFVPGMQQQMPPQEEMSMEQAYQQAKRGGIHLDPAKKGTFKAQATRMGMGIQEAAAHILANKDNYSSAMVKKANFARNFAKEEGGTINNPGFNALPEYVQNKILNNMQYGGDFDMPQYGKGGYTVRKTNERKGKTHVVTGPDGTKKYFGDPNMGERSKSKNGKDAFYARHAGNLKKNPYFRAYARATWETGGETLEPCPPGYVFYQGECVPWTEPNYDQVSNNGGYNPLTQTISSNPNIPRHSDIDWMQHEKYHHLQNIAGDMSSSGLLGMRPNPYVASDMSIAGYYDRRDNELNREIDNMIAKNNMLQFIPREKLRYGSAPGFIGADSLMYGRPGTVEGDARIYEKQVVQDPNVIQEAMYRKGGEMIKRADGSYSQRGLWDNIRANKGSGKKPTREMIEQERKLRRKAMGGMMGPDDCPEGYEWDDVYQVCVPMEGTVTPEASQTANNMRNWYNNRGQILTNPEYIAAITDPEFPNDTKKDIKRLEGNIQEMQNQYNQSEEGQPITPIEYTGPLADPNALGEYMYDDNGGIGSIRVRKDELLNPVNQQATMAHEWTTAGTHNFIEEPDYQKFYSNLLADNLMSWDDFRDRAIAEGKVGAKDKAGLNMLEGNYDYSVSPIEDNIHSNINVARQLFNLQPTDVITEEKVNEMLKIAEEKGYLDKDGPNYIDDIYRLYRLKKDNKSLANLFNLLASSGEGKNDVSGSDIQMAKYGGNIGKLRKFF